MERTTRMLVGVGLHTNVVVLVWKPQGVEVLVYRNGVLYTNIHLRNLSKLTD